jgi:hypothetical protein
MAGVCTAAILLLAVPLFTLEADARGGFGGHGGGFGGHGGFAGRGGMGFGGARSFGVARFGGAGVGARSFGVARFGGSSVRAHSFSVARFGGPRVGGRAFAGRSFAGRSLASPRGIATARFAGTGGRFTVASAHTLAGIRGAHWGGRGVFGNRAIANVAWRSQFASARFHGRFFGSRRAAEVCNDNAAQLTDWPIERISAVVEPTDAQRPALEELRAASAKAIDMLKAGCPKDLPSIPTGRLAAMESRLQVMLAAVQTVRPALERFYQSLSDEQKARFNAIAPAGEPDVAAKDQRDLTRFCDEKAPGVTDLPIDRIAQAVQPTPAQRAALDELRDASVKAAEGLKVNCPTYQTLTPTGRVEAMEKRLDATLAAVKTVKPALAKFYNSLSDEQKARFNSLRSPSKPVG